MVSKDMDVLYVRREVVYASSQLSKCALDNSTHRVKLSIVEHGSTIILDEKVISMWTIRIYRTSSVSWY